MPLTSWLTRLKRMIVTRSFLLHELMRRGERQEVCSCDDMSIVSALSQPHVLAEVQERT